MSDTMDSGMQWFDPTGGKGSVTARYGQTPSNAGQWEGKGVHTGVDYGIGANSAAYAIAGGKVTAAGYDPTVGNYVSLEIAPGKVVNYAHLNDVSVKAGQVVKGGESVGLTGNTGSSSRGAHLHNEYIMNGDFVSPEVFYGSKNIPAFAKGTYVQGSKSSLGKAWSYKGAPAIKGGTNVASVSSSKEFTSAKTPSNLGARLTSASTSSNVVSKIF